MVPLWIIDEVKQLTPAIVADMTREDCERAVGWMILVLASQSILIDEYEEGMGMIGIDPNILLVLVRDNNKIAEDEE